MPSGISWGEYLKFMSCAILSMMAGSQLVHMYFKPLQDLDLYIDEEMKQAKLAHRLKFKINPTTKPSE